MRRSIFKIIYFSLVLFLISMVTMMNAKIKTQRIQNNQLKVEKSSAEYMLTWCRLLVRGTGE